jgi:hypothetical protein
MTDHIVVFDGNPRLIGQTIDVQIKEASPFTLFGTVQTDETIGTPLAASRDDLEPIASIDHEKSGRIGLPLLS